MPLFVVTEGCCCGADAPGRLISCVVVVWSTTSKWVGSLCPSTRNGATDLWCGLELVEYCNEAVLLLNCRGREPGTHTAVLSQLHNVLHVHNDPGGRSSEIAPASCGYAPCSRSVFIQWVRRLKRRHTKRIVLTFKTGQIRPHA